MKKMITFLSGKLVSLMLILSVMIPYIAIMPLRTAAADADYVFSSGAVLLDSSYSGKNVLIKNGVFTVLVSGATDVNIIFDSVTIDRRHTGTISDPMNGKVVYKAYPDGYTGDRQTIYDMYKSGDGGLGWVSGGAVIPSTSPLLITNDSEVKLSFRGVNNLYAGTNWCTVSSSGVYNAKKLGGGFAGIQVDPGSTLTIEPGSGTVNAYGAHKNSVDDTSIYYDDKTGRPADVIENRASGGAGIGGGAYYSIDEGMQPMSGSNHGEKSGAAGTIIINGGNIYAQGGHQAAGIGGAFNAPATRTSITINNGNIVARGGQWATGIGDGDSNNHDKNGGESKYFNNENNNYNININGGDVTAIGGIACPGIGCTDEVTGYTISGSSIGTIGNISGLEINISGGSVTALSGYPQGFDTETGFDGDEAPAAIGAGSRSNMESNSITIHSSAKVIASGFGHYSITENGMVYDTIPTVNIDSDGYMFLARFPTLASKDERTFTLYAAQRETIFVTDGESEKEHQFIKYVTQPTDGSEPKAYYYSYEADEGRGMLLDENKQQIIPTAGTLEDLISSLVLTLYVDENSVKIDEVTAKAFFRSMAISLPNPAEYGGIYALTIPTSSIEGAGNLPSSGFMTATIGATEHGTISGEITYPYKHNILLDAVSEALVDLDVYTDGKHTDGTDGLIGNQFSENTFSYTVYIENDVDTVYLYGRYELEDKVNYDVDIDSEDTNPITSEDGQSAYVTKTIDMTGLSSRVVRVKKTDSVLGATPAGSIVYKITIIKKDVYTIEISSLDKVYDKRQVSPSVIRIYSDDTSNYQATTEEIDSTVFSYLGSPSGEDGTWTAFDGIPVNAGYYKVEAVINAKTYTARGSRTFQISKRPVTVSRIQNYLSYVSASELVSWTEPHYIEPGTITAYGIISGDNVWIGAETAYYNDVSVGYGSEKITLTGLSLKGDATAALNYTIEDEQNVFGQIAFLLDEAMFRRNPGSIWYKYYPVDSNLPIGYGVNPDYHSIANGDGVYDSHKEYVYARTVGGGETEKRYSADVVYGAMSFTYTNLSWNPTKLQYTESEGKSSWVGFDGETNAVKITNYSNAEIKYTVSCKIDFIHSSIGDDTTSGIKADIYAENSTDAEVVTDVARSLEAATPGDSNTKGTAQTVKCYLLLRGVPQFNEKQGATVVGRVSVTLEK